MPKNLKATLIEIFSAIQGEGVYVGYRHLFIRFAGCHLDCAFCDTPSTFKPDKFCKIEIQAGSRTFKKIENPIAIEKVLPSLDPFLKNSLHHAVSYTGGEPLLHYQYLKELTQYLKKTYPTMLFLLETSGDLYKQLQEVIDLIDIISMDIKLKSATRQEPNWAHVEKFLTIAQQKDCYIKIVVTDSTTLDELQTAGHLLATVNPNIPVILQPVTPFKHITNIPSPAQILEWQEYLYQTLTHVRVIPQTHKFIGQI